ncbi:MAG: DUF547 domain-containing protein [Nitrospirota bacterium]|nr:MAG: DUF547 domain-containing protein [Nitrospirota bacterium]
MRYQLLKTCLIVGMILLVFIQPALAFDFSSWDGILKKYVDSKTINGVTLNAVDYKKLAKDSAYTKIVKDIEAASLSTLKSKDEKLAFWINVYNIMAAKMVLDNYPVKSIKDAGSLFTAVWKKPVGVVAGKERTLNEIEHEILRKMGEPRIHVAIVCASVSCPDLRKEAYTADKLNNQLDDQMTQFLANPKKGLAVDDKKGYVYVSSIFKWFEEDFEPKGGVRTFIAPYSPEPLQALVTNDKLTVYYLDYDWGLNEL